MLLFTPFRLKHLELKNRLVMTSAATGLPTTEGYLTERSLDYYRRRAQGGVGLIIVEFTPVELAGKRRLNSPSLDNEGQAAMFRRLAEIVHGYGAKLILQTGHVGREASPEITGQPAVAPSPVPSAMKRLSDGSLGGKPKVLTIPDIEALAAKFGDFASKAKKAGLDGVELLCGHRGLFEQFLFTDSNQRRDQYGGSIENRARFMCDVVRSFRKAAGDDFIISTRVPATEYPEGGYSNEDIKKVFQLLEAAGVDVFNVTVSSTREAVNLQPMCFPRGSLAPLSQWVKSFVSVPVICAVRINDPRVGERILQEKKADLIGMLRPLLCDPELPNKAKAGRFDEIRTCIACNKCSEINYTTNLPIVCALNVETGREREMEIKPVSQRKKIMVVGGGPGGMETARVAAMRGHEVLLYEKASALGGTLLVAVLPPHKEEVANIVSYLKGQLEKLGVKVTLGKEVDAKLVRQVAPDVVVIATGASPLVPRIPGSGGKNVFTADDVLMGKMVGEKVAVIGGGVVGMETAEFLAERGKEVVVIEMLDRVGQDLESISRMFLRHRLAAKNVKTLTKTKVVGIKPDGVVVQAEGKEDFIPADSVVLAVGRKPNDGLARSLKGKFDVHVVGDCVEARGIMEAVHEGSQLARQL